MTDDRVLTRVRKLLAQAEHSSTSPEEAEAFSAKAAALMAKYVVDASLLDAASTTHSRPMSRTMTVLGPYTLPKTMLLSAVGDAYRVRVITSGETGGRRLATLVGFTADLDAVDVLFTSLLLQAASAMRIASATTNRPKAFRRAFLMGYAGTIGQRLRDVSQTATEDAVATAGAGAAVVLASRAREVDAAVEEMFPRLRSIRATISDGGGLAAGRDAGSTADLGVGRGRVSNRPMPSLR